MYDSASHHDYSHYEYIFKFMKMTRKLIETDL